MTTHIYEQKTGTPNFRNRPEAGKSLQGNASQRRQPKLRVQDRREQSQPISHFAIHSTLTM
jgi:hypothetical protein